MKVTPYLSFNGTCEEAFRLYAGVLGGKIVFSMTFGESPMADQAPPGWEKKIMHTTLALQDQVLQGSDMAPGHYRKPQGITLSLNLADAVEAERIFAALADQGTVQMPMQETFWAHRFGQVTDRFGTPWMINCEKPVEKKKG